MSNVEITVDSRNAMRMFAELTSKDRKKVFKKSIRDALNLIKREVISNLKGVINPSKIGKKDSHNNSFRKGVKVKVNRNCYEGKIHILGNYKLKFFELGTAQRFNKVNGRGYKLKKKRNTGSIPAYHFFKSAVSSKKSEAVNKLDSSISKSIQRIVNKYK